MTVASDELVKRARFLRNAAPQQFEEFGTAFAEYLTQQVDALLYATENLYIAQGHAQQCVKILKFLEEASHA